MAYLKKMFWVQALSWAVSKVCIHWLACSYGYCTWAKKGIEENNQSNNLDSWVLAQSNNLCLYSEKKQVLCWSDPLIILGPLVICSHFIFCVQVL
jgi:hypothetical protein